jgi:hypothetical protein
VELLLPIGVCLVLQDISGAAQGSVPCPDRQSELWFLLSRRCFRAWRWAEAVGTVVVTADMVVVTMAMVAATGISAATVTMEAGNSRYPVRFREAIFAAIVPLPAAVGRTSARSETRPWERETSAMR